MIKTMEKLLVGGPMLGLKPSAEDRDESQKSLKSQMMFTPIIDDESKYVFLPNENNVRVLSYKTGKHVATLLPSSDPSEDPVLISCAELATFPSSDISIDERDAVLFVACQDGSLHEYSLAELEELITSGESIPKPCGPFLVPGPCLGPRRKLQLSTEPISLLVVAGPYARLEPTKGAESLLIYIMTKNSLSTKRLHGSLFRVCIPCYDKDGRVTSLNLTKKKKNAITKIDSFRYIRNAKESRSNENPFPTQLAAVEFASSVFVVIANATSLTFIVDSTQTKYERVSFAIPSKNPLTVIAVNQKDVAYGQWSGEIRVMDSVLPIVHEYCHAKLVLQQQSNLKHPSRTIITRKLHWHAHPVTTLVYDKSGGHSGLLYSGGDESVLVTWQLNRGMYRPAEVLPRVALGGIMNIQCSKQQPSGLLVYCSDNSLQLVASHNRSRLWQIQGLASASTEQNLNETGGVRLRPTVQLDPTTGGSAATLMLTGLSQAPGYIHWYDPIEQQVIASLEVAPFNRVSRTEPGDLPLPSPAVTHAEWDSNGIILVTVDTVPTENTSVGALQPVSDRASVGVVNTIRFWKKGSGGVGSYNMVAAMAYPHGKTNLISALAVSLDGSYACSVSNDERAFRVWQRSKETEGKGAETMKENDFGWKCYYRVTFPSGYAKYPVGPCAVAFSSDTSVLGIVFGCNITLWDCKQVTLLTALRHLDDDDAPVDSLQFITCNRFQNVLLASSKAGVSLRSPFGRNGPKIGWVWKPTSPSELVLGVHFIYEREMVAISVRNAEGDSSRIVVLNGATGQESHAYGVIDNIPAQSIALSSTSSNVPVNGWGNRYDGKPPTPLLALTNNGCLLMILGANRRAIVSASRVIEVEYSAVPKLPLIGTNQSYSKREREIMNVGDFADRPGKKMSLESFGAFASGDVDTTAIPTQDLPRLRGAFARAFLGRHLQLSEQ